jgi:CHASE2 domain-containing sensor protein
MLAKLWLVCITAIGVYVVCFAALCYLILSEKMKAPAIPWLLGLMLVSAVIGSTIAAFANRKEHFNLEKARDA